MSYWRRTGSFLRHAYTANFALRCAGFLLVGYQIASYFISSSTKKILMHNTECPNRADIPHPGN